jgi:hypothetical protein
VAVKGPDLSGPFSISALQLVSISATYRIGAPALENRNAKGELRRAGDSRCLHTLAEVLTG